MQIKEQCKFCLPHAANLALQAKVDKLVSDFSSLTNNALQDSLVIPKFKE
jgi:hypothetical protein